MREQLIQYVELLFAGAADCEDIKQEILQNTLDRYDDLIAEGKVPQAAYRLAIAGIGDINEILGTPAPAVSGFTAPAAPAAEPRQTDTPIKSLMRAIAIGLYILCPAPLFVLSEIGLSTLGLCGLLAMVAVATVLIILGKKNEEDPPRREEPSLTPENQLRKSIESTIWAIGLALYFVISFATSAWYVTWLMFPIIGAVKGLANAILDLKEAQTYEN